MCLSCGLEDFVWVLVVMLGLFIDGGFGWMGYCIVLKRGVFW